MTDHPQPAATIVASIEIGARMPYGLTGRLVLAFAWSACQLYIASAITFFLSEYLSLNLIFNNQEARHIHLAFALILAMLPYPPFKSSSRDRIPLSDWVLAALALVSCLYLFFNKYAISDRAGLPTTVDMVMSTIGILCLAIAVFRALGLPLAIVASVFLPMCFWVMCRLCPRRSGEKVPLSATPVGISGCGPKACSALP